MTKQELIEHCRETFEHYLPENYFRDAYFVEMLQDYIEHRITGTNTNRPLGERFSDMAIKRLCTKLLRYLPDECAIALETSVSSGWTGVFFAGEQSKNMKKLEGKTKIRAFSVVRESERIYKSFCGLHKQHITNDEGNIFYRNVYLPVRRKYMRKVNPRILLNALFELYDYIIRIHRTIVVYSDYLKWLEEQTWIEQYSLKTCFTPVGGIFMKFENELGERYSVV